MSEYSDPKKSLILYEFNDKFSFLINLYNSKRMPKVLMMSGKKGIGKFTLINHVLSYIFDKDNYDVQNKNINNNTNYYKQYLLNIFPNVMYFSGNDFKNVKVEDVRTLKSRLIKTNVSLKERFIIIDDIELFNENSLNALLKIIEEPSSNNHFILINNKTKHLIDTVYSRSLELKILLNNITRLKIIESLIKRDNLQILIDFKNFNLSPGNFLTFNRICIENKIQVDKSFLQNLHTLLSLYKKSKDINLINMILYLTDYYFKNIQEKKINNIEKVVENKLFVLNNINKFITFNLNQNSLINSITNKLSNE